MWRGNNLPDDATLPCGSAASAGVVGSHILAFEELPHFWAATESFPPRASVSRLRAVLEGLWLRYKGEAVEEDVLRERRRRLFQTGTWFLLTLLLALFIPDIGRVIAVIGGLAACFIFIFPGKGIFPGQLENVAVVLGPQF